MRFRPITRPFNAPRRARVVAALALLILAAAVVLAGAGLVSLSGALVSLIVAGVLAIIAVALAVYSLNYIWTNTGVGTRDATLALIWALPVVVAVAALTYTVTQTPSFPDIATNVNNPPAFEVLARGEDLPLDVAAPADRLSVQLAHPDLTTNYVERPGWHLAEVLETLAESANWQVVRLDTQSGLSFDAELVVPNALLLVQNDVAIRINDDGSGSTIDVRSVSNLPLHDFGTNAQVVDTVIARFLLAIEATEPPSSDL